MVNKLSIYIQGTGGLIVIVAIIRWFFLWYDPSQAVLGIAIGLIIVGFAEIYKMLRVCFDDIEKNKKRLDAMSQWYSKQEFE